MRIKKLMFILISILVLLSILWYKGAQPEIVSVNNESILLRTAQAVDFTVQHPYSWIREFISIPELIDDKTVIPQGISDDKPFMVLYPLSETKTIRILFSVNDFNQSGITLDEYSQIIELAMEEYNEFTLVIKDLKEEEYYYEYTYSYSNKKFTEIKKFSYKNGKLLTVVATFNSNLTEKYYDLTKKIVKTTFLR